jgi:hypothetical protein
MDVETITLWRPTGPNELHLVGPTELVATYR